MATSALVIERPRGAEEELRFKKPNVYLLRFSRVEMLHSYFQRRLLLVKSCSYHASYAFEMRRVTSVWTETGSIPK
jgi:hypothetical protein